MTRKPRRRVAVAPRFDREAFLLGVGMGVASIALGSFTIWVSSTAPEGDTYVMALSTSQRLTRALFSPDARSQIAVVIGGLFVAFGMVALTLGLGVAVRYALKRPR